jgi:Pentapeptide repeats (9 copies)
MLSQKSEQNEYPCHISDDIHAKNRYLNDVDDVRAKVCFDLSRIKHTDGKHYCILHLPSKDKNESLFNSVLQARLGIVENEFINIESNLSEFQKSEAKSKLKYDFRYVWFSKEANFSKHIFVANLDFSDAVFNNGAFFNNSVLLAEARFVGTNFKESAKFSGTKFIANANFLLASFAFAEFVSTTFSLERETVFKQAKFGGESWFDWTTFGDVDFSSATFNGKADFKSTTFSGESKFNETEFSKTSKTSFYKAKFTKDTFFDKTSFNNDVSFNSTVFGGDSDVIFRDALFEKYVSFRYSTSEGYLRFIDLKQGKECSFTFQEAAFEKANRVSFYNLRLQPHWFVNVDSKSFVFTNCHWKQSNNSNVNVKSELAKLTKTPNSHELLTKTCWQLASNHEESNSFSKASMFRQFAQESKRREDVRWKQPFTLHWWYCLSSFYGENWKWALGVLLSLILVIFPIIYTRTNFQTCSKDRPIAASLTVCESKDEEIRKNCTCRTDQIALTDAIVQSLTTATLQNVEYRKPLTVWGEIWIILEKIFAPLQAALLALAIRRKFMR